MTRPLRTLARYARRETIAVAISRADELLDPSYAITYLGIAVFRVRP